MFKKLKSLFIIEDESAQKKAVEKVAEEEKINPPPKSKVKAKSPSIDIDLPESTVKKSGKPDSKFVDILLKAVEKNNKEGFDYLEYKSSLQSLSKLEMDEQTRFKSAFAMAVTMGVSKEKLVSSAKHYVDVLKAEKAKFGDALKNQRNKQIGGREQEIDATQKNIVAKQKQIEKLQAEIKKDTANLEKMKKSINQAAAKVQSTNDNFNYAYGIVQGQILEDVEKINQYL